MQDITFEEIERLEDFGDIDEVSSKYDIPLDGCDSCEDCVERIILHKQKLTGHHKLLLDPQRYENLKQEQNQKRETICSIFKSVRKNLDGSFELLSRILDCRGITKDLSRDIDDHLESLQNGDCNIVIAGQTSAGKSTLLNLLLGMEILPKHCLSCTSSICKLRYGPKFKVKIIQEQEVSEREFKNLEETTTYLDSLVAEKEFSRRASGDTIPEVEIYLPADILKSGVTVVDTPGFGEYEAMDNLVKDFVTKKRVAAFIYVIKTDSAGGVQEDRLVRFLKTFLEHNKKREGENNNVQEQQSFNPRAALFVCNRWDQIEDDEKPEVKTSVLEKLKDVWPKLNDNQVCFFSTTRAQASLDVDKEYITKELLHLLNSLNGLFGLAQQDTIKMSYGWMKSVMRECTIYLKTILAQRNMADREHEEKFLRARKQLEALQTRADDMIEELRKELEEASDKLVTKFRLNLSSDEFQEKVREWNIRDIPPIPASYEAMEEYKTLLDSMIVNKIFRVIDNMDECKLFVSELRSRILSKIKERLRLLDDDMDEVSADLNGGSFRSSTSSDRSCSSDEEDAIVEELKQKRDAKQFAQKIRNYTLTRSVSWGLNPRAIVSRAIAPIIFKVIDTWAQQKHDQRRRSSQANPRQAIVARSESVLKTVMNDDKILRKFVSRYTEKLVQQINCISLNIPSFIQANETLMKEVIMYRREVRQERCELRSTMECLEPLREMLRGFGYVHVKDFASDDIMFHMDEHSLRNRSSTQFQVNTFLHSSQSDVGSKRDAAQGLWAVVQKAELAFGEKKLPVMVRCYTNQLPDDHLFKEIAKLRCLEDLSVATFLGMTHTEAIPSFVFSDHLTSARRYLRRYTTNVRQAVPHILIKLVEGLEAIHRDELVHMELSLDTVMVTDRGDVKLCNMCLPRKCKFPTDKEMIEAADFTCLSPSVLKGGMYNRGADKYSFGIIVYELLMPHKPYAEQRTWKLSRFISEVHPGFMLKLGEQEMSEPLSELLCGCLLPGEGLRLPFVRIKEILKTLKDEISSLRNLRHKIERKSTLTESVRRHTLKRSTRSSSSDGDFVTISGKEEFV